MGQTVSQVRDATSSATGHGHHGRGGTAPSTFQFAADEMAALRRAFQDMTGSGAKTASASAFTKALRLPPPLHSFGDRLFAAYSSVEGAGEGELREEQYLRATEICLKSPVSQQLRFVFSMYSRSAKPGAQIDKATMTEMLLDLALLFHFMRQEEAEGDKSDDVDYDLLKEYWTEKIINAMVESIMGFESVSSLEVRDSNDSQNADGFAEWATENSAHLCSSSLVILLTRRFLQDEAEWPLPIVQHVAGSHQLLDMPKLWALSVALDENREPYPWRVVYSSSENGTSFNRFANGLFGYPGPALLIIRDKKGNIFGGYIHAEWKDETRFYGSPGSLLFSLNPKLNVYRGHGSQQNYLFCNTRKNAYSDVPVGVGFGGDIGSFRLWIDGEFTTGTSRAIDSTYRKGPLLADFNFKIAEIVVWGCGGQEADKAQVVAKQREAKEVENRRKVNKKMAGESWTSGPDKWLMDLVGRTGHANEFQDEFEAYKKNKAAGGGGGEGGGDAS